MKKTLWLYGMLVFAGGLIGGALTNEVCRSRIVAAASAVTSTDAKSANDAKTAASAPLQRVVTASEFVVLDAVGKPRVRIGVNADGQAGFAVYDRDHNPRARIIVDSQGVPSVRLYDTTNKLRLSLEISTDAIPTIRLMDNGDHARALLGVDAEGEAGLNFYAEDGRLLRELP
jgi:hypothetical protein